MFMHMIPIISHNFKNTIILYILQKDITKMIRRWIKDAAADFHQPIL